VYSNNIKLVKKICTQVIKVCRKQGIYKRIHELTSILTLTKANHNKLEVLDRDLTRILVKADQKWVKSLVSQVT